MELPIGLTKEEVECIVSEAEESKEWLEGKDPRKVIVVQNKIVNIVL